MNTEQQLQDTEQRVTQLMTEDERCRNDDLWLILRYWKDQQHITLRILYADIKRMTTPETITRARRRIQNTNGILLPTDPQVLIQRRIRETDIRNYYGTKHNIYQEYQATRYTIQ